MSPTTALRCAIYTRVSSDAGLEQNFNSLDAQREASEAFIRSQTHEGWREIRTAYDDGGYSGGNLDRPALRRLWDDVNAGLIDVVVVYKVDRLTRSLADFAKLVELFDAKGVSFVSVTQAFNTTSSMGRLTLNVLLSFAQFEREVTGERIRDKIAASKKKGIWTGGNVPFGYKVENRKLIAVSAEAAIVKSIFERYLKLGSMPALLGELNTKGIRTRLRCISTGTRGGVPFTVGPLAYILKNRIYLGEVHHKGQWYPGEHPAILNLEMFQAVQVRMAQNLRNDAVDREASNAPLLGVIVDDRGNRMSPSFTCRGNIRYRYYVSRAVLERQHDKIGAIRRVQAPDVEKKVLEILRSVGMEYDTDITEQTILDVVQRVRVEPGRIVVEFCDEFAPGMKERQLCVPWSPDLKRGRRNMAIQHTCLSKDQRPIRTDRRDALMRTVAMGRAWLKELSSRKVENVETIAAREGRSKRSIQMIISLSFVAPKIIEAAVAGGLPRGVGVTRLMNLPPLWAKQFQVLGLNI